VVPPVQPARATEVQPQLEVSQQTPAHAEAQVPPQEKVLGEVQADGSVTVHAPVEALQHLPVQGLGVQVLEAPW
jgi:hypothetical protein